MSDPTYADLSADPACLVPGQVLASCSDEALEVTIAVLRSEQQRRALVAGDVDALVAEAFERAFDRTGRAGLPFLHDGLLICPGSKVSRSKSSHDCTFVSLDAGWVWEHPDVAADSGITLPGGKIHQFVTVIPAFEAMKFDVVTSVARSGPCRMKSVRTYTISGGTLHEVSVRARSEGSYSSGERL